MQLRPALIYPFLLLAIGPLPQFAAAQTANPERPASAAIVELFTCEGCLSCPPADALLRQINLKQTSAGQLIIGISEHVTYWNNLGWKDPYSSPEFTERQEVYATRLSPEGPYTPQMVVNEREQIPRSSDETERTLLDCIWRLRRNLNPRYRRETSTLLGSVGIPMASTGIHR